MNRNEVRAQIEKYGIVPSVRVPDAEHARFAAEAVKRAGIPIAEITLTVEGAVDVIAKLAASNPDMVIGAGTVLDVESAQRCLDAGASFLSMPGLVMEVIEYALKREVAVLPGALTPTEIIAAWKAGGDLIKVFPCGPLGGDKYISALKIPLPQIPIIASGGVNQLTAANFILSGATALGIGSELIPIEALKWRREEQIHELARRFLNIVREARAQRAARSETPSGGPSDKDRGRKRAKQPV